MLMHRGSTFRTLGLTVSVKIQPANPAAALNGFFQIAVRTVRPFYTISHGSPTFTGAEPVASR